MKTDNNTLTIEELDSILELAHHAGSKGIDFKTFRADVFGKREFTSQSKKVESLEKELKEAVENSVHLTNRIKNHYSPSLDVTKEALNNITTDFSNWKNSEGGDNLFCTAMHQALSKVDNYNFVIENGKQF